MKAQNSSAGGRVVALVVFVCLATVRPAPAHQTAAIGARGAVTVSLGQPLVPLYGPWKFTVGDSPVDPATGQPLWAEREFDDSSWESVDLTPKRGATDPLAGESGHAEGWSKRGHPGYWGYAWYRIRVHIEGQPGEALSVAGPDDVDDGFQAFANGKLAGQFGDFRKFPPRVFFPQPVEFALPAVSSTPTPPAGGSPQIQQNGGDYVLAFRVWMSPFTLTLEQDPGHVAGGADLHVNDDLLIGAGQQ
jgi:hypothetical protein